MEKTRIEWEEGIKVNQYRYNPSDKEEESAFIFHLQNKGWKIEEYDEQYGAGHYYHKKDIFSTGDEDHRKPLAEFIEHGSAIVGLDKDKRLESFLEKYDFKRERARVEIRFEDIWHYQIWSKNKPAPRRLLG